MFTSSMAWLASASPRGSPARMCTSARMDTGRGAVFAVVLAVSAHRAGGVLLGGVELAQVKPDPRGDAIHARAVECVVGCPPVVRLGKVPQVPARTQACEEPVSRGQGLPVTTLFYRVVSRSYLLPVWSAMLLNTPLQRSRRCLRRPRTYSESGSSSGRSCPGPRYCAWPSAVLGRDPAGQS